MSDQSSGLVTPVTPSPIAVDDPGLYINRELSWLAFNARVLAQAWDRTPVSATLISWSVNSVICSEMDRPGWSYREHKLAMLRERNNQQRNVILKATRMD